MFDLQSHMPALITPTVLFPEAGTFHHTGGVYDAKGDIIASCYRLNGLNTHIDPLRSDDIIPEAVIGPSVYMGIITNHYGHFLIEALARAWIFMEEYRHLIPDVENLVFHKLFTIPHLDIQTFLPHPFYQTVFTRLGLQQYNIMAIERPTQIQKLYIPECLASINLKIDPYQQRIYDMIRGPTIDYNRLSTDCTRLYIARNGDRIKNEAAMISIFEKYGFTIIFPSIPNFNSDLEKYQRAKVIAGIDGTNLHNVVFAPRGSALIHINYRSITTNQLQLNRINQINCHIIESIGDPTMMDLQHLEHRLQTILQSI